MSKADYHKLLLEVEKWLLDNHSRHPDYLDKIRQRNELKIKIETIKRPVSYGQKLPYSIPKFLQN